MKSMDSKGRYISLLKMVVMGSRLNISVALLIHIVLGLWPGVEVVFTRDAVNQLAAGTRMQAVYTLLTMMGCGIVVVVLHIMNPYIIERTKASVSASLWKQFFTVYATCQPDDLLVPKTQDKFAKARNSLGKIEQTVIRDLFMFLQGAISVISVSWILFLVGWWCPLLILVGTVVNTVMAQRAARIDTDIVNRTSELGRREKAFSGILTDRLHTREIRINQTFPFLLGRWNSIFGQVSRESLKATRKASIYSFFGRTANSFTTIALIGLGLILLQKGEAGPGQMTALITGGMYLEGFMAMILSQSRFWLGHGVFLSPLVDVASPKESKPSRKKESPVAVELRQVAFRYPGAQTDALADVNLKIRHGSKIAIVGPNGGGKTTLLNLILGVYRPRVGKVVKNMDKMSASFQRFGRYRLSARQNVILGDIQRFEDPVTASLQTACCDFINEGPGLDTPLWPELGGQDLSEGQWNRLAIARALFRLQSENNGLIALDEPTSALDPDIELELLTRVMNVLENQTVLFVVHRLVGCRFADEIIVVDRGGVVAHGTHQDLLECCDLYCSLWEASSRFSREGER